MKNLIINDNPNLKTSRLIEELVGIVDQNLPLKAFMNLDQSYVPGLEVGVLYCYVWARGRGCHTFYVWARGKSYPTFYV